MGFRITCPHAKAQSEMAKTVARYKREGIEVVVDAVAADTFLSSLGADGSVQATIIGQTGVKNWLRYGYNRIRRRCPHRILGLLPCQGPKCQHYIVEFGTGDCSANWSAVLLIADRKDMQERARAMMTRSRPQETVSNEHV